MPELARSHDVEEKLQPKPLPKSIKSILEDVGINKVTRECIPLNLLKIDPRYQRTISSDRVSGLCKDFHAAACGELLVSKRSDGYYLIDGQHRARAMEKLGLKHWYCQVMIGLSAEEEAAVWEKCNTYRGRPPACEVFKERLFRKEPMAVQIADVVEKQGFVLYLKAGGKSRNGRMINAVSSLDRIWRAGGKPALDLVLEIIRRSWGDEEDRATDGMVLYGIHCFATNETWNGLWDVDTLCAKLKAYGVKKIIREVNAYKATFGGFTAATFARVMAKAYNVRNRRKLPIN